MIRGTPGAHYGPGKVPLVSTADDAAAGAYTQDGGARGSGAVSVTLPAGFDCVSSDPDDEEVEATGQ